MIFLKNNVARDVEMMTNMIITLIILLSFIIANEATETRAKL